MTQEQYDYEMGAAAQAQYEAEMAYYDYLDSLIKNKEYELHGIEIVLDILGSKHFAQSNLNPIDYLVKRKYELLKISTPVTDHPNTI